MTAPCGLQYTGKRGEVIINCSYHYYGVPGVSPAGEFTTQLQGAGLIDPAQLYAIADAARKQFAVDSDYTKQARIVNATNVELGDVDLAAIAPDAITNPPSWWAGLVVRNQEVRQKRRAATDAARLTAQGFSQEQITQITATPTVQGPIAPAPTLPTGGVTTIDPTVTILPTSITPQVPLIPEGAPPTFVPPALTVAGGSGGTASGTAGPSTTTAPVESPQTAKLLGVPLTVWLLVGVGTLLLLARGSDGS